MRLFIILWLLLIAGCAAQQTATLLPRGDGLQQGAGTLDRLQNILTVNLNGRQYQGRMVMNTATTTSLFGASRTTTSSQASALLLGDGGQIRCEFGFDYMMTMATGVCIDSKNVTYDLLIQN